MHREAHKCTPISTPHIHTYMYRHTDIHIDTHTQTYIHIHSDT